MKFAAFCVLVAMAAAPAFADEATEEANKKLVIDFYEMAFNQHKPADAAAAFIGDVYIQHNPNVPNGTEALAGFFDGYFKENPLSKSTIVRAAADGDLVWLHVNDQPNPDALGAAVVDIFRVENGKIVEHWDVIQEVPATTANGNTMFDGTNAN